MCQPWRYPSVVTTWLDKIREFQRDLEAAAQASNELATKIEADCEVLGRSVSAVDESWSRSWLGHQASTYYGEFGRPPSSYDIDWGSLQVQPGWRQRTYDDVLQRVEELAGVTVAALQTSAAGYRQMLTPIPSELAIVLAPLRDRPEFTDEAKKLKDSERLNWASGTAILNMWAPRNSISRDSSALLQGIQAPPHKKILAAVYEAKDSITVGRRFLENARTLIGEVLHRLEVADEYTEYKQLRRWVPLVRRVDAAWRWLKRPFSVLTGGFVQRLENHPLIRLLLLIGGIGGILAPLFWIISKVF